MKKYSFTIVAFAATMFTACSGSPKSAETSDSLPLETIEASRVETAGTDQISAVQDVETPVETESHEQVKPAKAEEAAKKVVAAPTTIQDTPADNAVKEEKPSIVGTWVMLSTDTYNVADELDDSEQANGAEWEFSESTVTVHDEEDLLDGKPLNYTLNGKQMKVQDITLTFTILQLTKTKLVLRTSEFNERYSVFTFKRK